MGNTETQTKERGRSSTSDILGIGKPPSVHHQWAEQLEKLTDLRDRLLRERHYQTDTAREELAIFGEHIAEAGTDSFEKDCALALLSSTQDALYEIDLALTRIHNGTYGTCELTGERIEAARLQAIPWTRFSLAAQARLEERGAGRIRLGQLGSLEHGQRGDSGAEAGEEAEEGRMATA